MYSICLLNGKKLLSVTKVCLLLRPGLGGSLNDRQNPLSVVVKVINGVHSDCLMITLSMIDC